MLAAAFVIGLWASRAGAGDEVHCLDKEQQRAAITSGKAVHLAQALRATGGRNPGEVVKIRLCETPKGLVYRLTVLAPNGKVTRVNVDAASGHVVGGL
jgi:uncharacterized membrane protein YkoI